MIFVTSLILATFHIKRYDIANDALLALCSHVPKGAKRAKEIKAHSYAECTSKEPPSVGKVVMEAVSIVIQADKDRKVKNEKQYKQELKKEEKEAKKLAKAMKKENRNSTTLPPSNGTDKGKQPETAS